ncbi:hypothetical protein P886_1968 [Alteromonadaceae bacterium 2753L.S.0a.02]|nr:hypothetical protein P886_1968 [Alteromonadaceae bacterium 2753L.S.0a.02]
MDIRERLQNIGGDIFVAEFAGERRVKPNESWLGYSRNLIIWFNSESFTDGDIDAAASILKLMPKISVVRISGCAVTEKGFERLKSKVIGPRIEYVPFYSRKT